MGIHGKAKTVMYEVVGAFVVILLLVVLRPLFIGQVETASQPYSITYTNSTGASATKTITPSTTLSSTTADTLYTVAIFVVVLVALVIIALTMFGKAM